MLTDLSQFRQSAYQLLNFAQDSTFELMDAILTTKNLKSFPELSFSPLFRRHWSSIYESISDCRPSANKLMKLYLQQMTTDIRPLIAGDHTPWGRQIRFYSQRSYPSTFAAIKGKCDLGTRI